MIWHKATQEHNEVKESFIWFFLVFCGYTVHSRSGTVLCIFFPWRYHPILHTHTNTHTHSLVCTSSQVGVGKGCEVHQADLKWLKSSLQCLFYAFHVEWGKPSWNYFPVHRELEKEQKKKRIEGVEKVFLRGLGM